MNRHIYRNQTLWLEFVKSDINLDLFYQTIHLAKVISSMYIMKFLINLISIKFD